MLGLSSHAWKVSFCKFTNETRNGIEDSSAHSGLKFIAACNGSTAGGGYELALACEKRRVDDRDFHSALPEEPGVVARSQRRARRHGHASSFHCAEVRGGELRDIREYQQDSPFLLKPQREQPIADPVNLLSDLAISQPAVAADDRGFLRPSFPDVTVHEMVDEIVAALP
jgi:benzoyl-CoA-dihydrodiol lyase